MRSQGTHTRSVLLRGSSGKTVALLNTCAHVLLFSEQGQECGLPGALKGLVSLIPGHTQQHSGPQNITCGCYMAAGHHLPLEINTYALKTASGVLGKELVSREFAFQCRLLRWEVRACRGEGCGSGSGGVQAGDLFSPVVHLSSHLWQIPGKREHRVPLT